MIILLTHHTLLTYTYMSSRWMVCCRLIDLACISPSHHIHSKSHGAEQSPKSSHCLINIGHWQINVKERFTYISEGDICHLQKLTYFTLEFWTHCQPIITTVPEVAPISIMANPMWTCHNNGAMTSWTWCLWLTAK